MLDFKRSQFKYVFREDLLPVEVVMVQLPLILKRVHQVVIHRALLVVMEVVMGRVPHRIIGDPRKITGRVSHGELKN